MMPWPQLLWYWLVDYYALASCVLLGAGLAMLRTRQPARRLTLCECALAGLAVLLVCGATASWPRFSLVAALPSPRQARPSSERTPHAPAAALVPAAAPALEHHGLERPAPAGVPDNPQSASGQLASSTKPAPRIARAPWLREAMRGAAGDISPALVSGSFLAGAVLMLGWLALGAWQMGSLRRRAQPAPEQLAAALARVVGPGRLGPELRVSDTAPQPVALGILRPAIILPDRFATEESQSRLETALAHEWAHIRNRDLWLIALVRLLLPVLYAHPTYWWLRRRIRDDQEALADASAAAIMGRADYAEVLLAWSRSACGRMPLAAGGSLAMFERSSQIARRIRVLLDRSFSIESACPPRWRLGVRGGAALCILGISLVTIRPAAVGAAGDSPQSEQRPGQTGGAQTAEPLGESISVLDPDGKPLAGARVYLTAERNIRKSRSDGAARYVATTGPDGSFRLSRNDAQAAFHRDVQVVVMAAGCGPAIGDDSVANGMKVLRLPEDDVPIRGRLLDTQGQPVAGATVQLAGLFWYAFGNLDEWLAAMKTEKAADPFQYQLRQWVSEDIPSLFPAVTTDREGRFTLRGVGRERIASLLISGAGVETRCEYVATREMPAVKVADFIGPGGHRNITYHGAVFDLVAGPGLEIVGTVRDKDTGKPLSGITVQTTASFGDPRRVFETISDAGGRYRLSGVPHRTSYGYQQEVLARVKDGLPYLSSLQRVADESGRGPIVTNFELKRGIWARGRVTDKSTGKPVWANVDYFIPEDNPHLNEYPPYGTDRNPVFADRNGEYKIVVIPGRGILGARFGNDTYRLGVGIDKIKGLKRDSAGQIRARPHAFSPMNHNALVEIDPKERDESVTADIELDRGRTLKGKLVGPDGQPVAGALMMGAQDFFQMWSHQALSSAEFEVRALGSEDKRGLVFYQEEKGLAGAYVVQPGELGPVTVRLEPCGTLTGRLVDDGGLPQAAVRMSCRRPYEGGDSRFQKGSLPSPVKTDKDGRFRVSGLVPGLKYSLEVRKDVMIAGYPAMDVTTRAGEALDLGDVKVTPNN
jgi:Zn-dependent protease with chaperone function